MPGLRPSLISFGRALSWAVPAQAPEAVCPTLQLPVFVGGQEPKVSCPWSRQSPPAHSHQTASGANAPLRSASLVIGRLIDGTHNLAHVPAVNETANNQGPQADVRFSLSASSNAVPRPEGRERVYKYATGGSGAAAAVISLRYSRVNLPIRSLEANSELKSSTPQPPPM